MRSLKFWSKSKENPTVPASSTKDSATYQYKLVLLGETAVGKSCLTTRFCKDVFLDYQDSTIGAAFMTKTINLESSVVKFEIWDTAGQERYRSLAPMYYRGASAALIVYDITSADTFEQARSWINELKAVSRADVIIALAGNKVDLERNRSVDIETAQNFAKLNNCLFMETSAKTGHNVQEMFMKIANLLPRDNNPTLESVHFDQPTQAFSNCCNQ
ncbi:Rab family, other [Babesia microti strain RI]|uniref:Rab family, other n=1 Tax=Babesia microti (strain RI) TaxID=1133968 RepID=A0A1R4ABC7_BABMR|nr:Rab family, other [Babesia microti strain RI]SJK86319.1 Rab family, other [Babesia microti strain RI]|eukprot:XP_021338491.1 Rab family, other [Babesia microti strain RI]